MEDVRAKMRGDDAARAIRSCYRSWCHQEFGGDVWAKLLMATGTVNGQLVRALDECSAEREAIPEHLRRANGLPVPVRKDREPGEKGIIHLPSEAKVARELAKALDKEIKDADWYWHRHGETKLQWWQWEDLKQRREARPDVCLH
jgi:hypothetical protein